MEKTGKEYASQPDQLPLYKMRDEDGKLIYHRVSEDPVQDDTEPENLPLMQDAVAALYLEQEENTRNENGDETTEIIFEGQQAELDIEEHNPIAIHVDMDLHSDEQLDAESPRDYSRY